MSRDQYSIVDEKGEFIFRFKLDLDQTKLEIKDNAFVELIRSQLDELLKFVVLTKDGKRVRVNGFKFINDPEHNYAIWMIRDNETGSGGVSETQDLSSRSNGTCIEETHVA